MMERSPGQSTFSLVKGWYVVVLASRISWNSGLSGLDIMDACCMMSGSCFAKRSRVPRIKKSTCCWNGLNRSTIAIHVLKEQDRSCFGFLFFYAVFLVSYGVTVIGPKWVSVHSVVARFTSLRRQNFLRVYRADWLSQLVLVFGTLGLPLWNFLMCIDTAL